MECKHCNRTNRLEALFCKWCGSPLAADDSTISILLPDIVALDDIKKELNEIIDVHAKWLEKVKQRGIKTVRNNDMIIMGPSGSGKTTLVKAIAKLYHANGIISSSEPLMLNASTTLSGYIEKINEHIDDLNGKILCIDDFQTLAKVSSQNSIKEVDRLFEVKKLMEETGKSFTLILAGIDDGFSKYLHNNPNVKNNFRYIFHLGNYSLDDLTEICIKLINRDMGMSISVDAQKKLKNVLKKKFLDKDEALNGNGKFARNFVDELFENALKRGDSDVIQPGDIPGEEYVQKTYEEAVKELDNFVGIDAIRDEIKKIGDGIMQARDDGEEYELSNHYLFLGNPGTGKTTIARVFSNVFTALEVLPVGHIIEVDRSQIVSKYIGETAEKVHDLVNKAMGGILFIDEAYTLIKDENDSVGKEAVDTLLKLMEDRRGKFVVIAAGYTNEMRKFTDSNPGLKSRFNKTIYFRDYTPEEMTEIFRKMLCGKKVRYTLSPDADEHLLSYFKGIYGMRSKDFANARTVRNELQKAIERYKSRIENLKSKGKDVTELKYILTRFDIEGDTYVNNQSVETILAELNELIGLENVKKSIKDLKDNLELNRERIERGLLNPENTAQHIVITGNPGTGKTTIAKMLGRIFKAIGLLPTDKVIEKEAKNLKSSYMNDTAKRMDDAVDEAMGGILFIDEAYMLMDVDASGHGDKTGKEAVGALITRMLNDAGKFVLIIAGYPKEINEFIDTANPGFRSRFKTFIHIDDYSVSELVQIFKLKAQKMNLCLTSEAETLLKKKVEKMVLVKNENFGNAREMNNLLDSVRKELDKRLSKKQAEGADLTDKELMTITEADIPYEKLREIDASEVLENLDKLIGLGSVKKEIHSLIRKLNADKKRAEFLGTDTKIMLDHYVFMGNPGTGKTTVAQMMADIFFSMGMLPTNNLVAVERKDLVKGYLGQTAINVNRIVKSALGGVLFIDEAYALVQSDNDSFGMEALNTLLPLLLTYKNKFVCIVAGYTGEMTDFLHRNTGLSSRFTKRIIFEDYSPKELNDIFLLKLRSAGFCITSDAMSKSLKHFENIYNRRDAHFGNAREAGNYFERVKELQGERIGKMDFQSPDFDKSDLIEIISDDIV